MTGQVCLKTHIWMVWSEQLKLNKITVNSRKLYILVPHISAVQIV